MENSTIVGPKTCCVQLNPMLHISSDTMWKFTDFTVVASEKLHQMGCELLHKIYVFLIDDCELNCVTFNGFLHRHQMFESEANRLRISPLFSIYVRMNLKVPSC